MAMTPKSTGDTGKSTSGGAGFSDFEKKAMKERAEELKKEKRRGKKDGLEDLLEKIDAMPPQDREIAQRIHEIVTEVAPHLAPRTWYGMPAYAKDGKVLCFFQSAAKYEVRYSTLGFNDPAALDDGPMWPVTYAITEITDEVSERITELVRRAVG